MLKITCKILLIVIFLLTNNSRAQFYSFGRNKVQYESFKWNVIRTKHFNIYFYGRLKSIAETGAKFAEEAYRQDKVIFNHVVLTRIPLIIYNTHIQFQQTNTTPGFIPEGVSGFFEFIKGRVVIPYLGSISKFKHVIRHELIHVFMTSKIFSVLRTHRIPDDRYPPLWFTEGLAEYYSTHWDVQADMVIRDAVLNNTFVPIKEIQKINGTFLMYKEGQLFLEFLTQQYGGDLILKLLENFWRFEKFNKLLEFTLGKSIDKISDDFNFWVKQRYYPVLKSKFSFQSRSQKLTSEGFNTNPVAISDSKKVIFIGNRNGYASIYEMTDFIGSTSAAPKIKLIIKGETQAELEAFHLMQNSLDVSSKGTIVFVTKEGGRDALHFYSMKTGKIHDRKFKELISLRDPKFSGDGSKVVFSAIDNKGYSDLFVYDITSNKLNRLTNDYYEDITPIFNRSGSKVYFSSDRTGGIYKKKFNIFSISLKDYSIQYVTYANSNITMPTFDSSQSNLYVISDSGGSDNLWKIYFKENLPIGMKQITNFYSNIFNYSFINDSTIVFAGFEDYSLNIYKYKIKKTDTVKRVKFDFTKSQGIWKAPQIKLTSNKKILKYKKHYTIDYAFSQIETDPVFGTRGGAVISLSDLLSDDKFYLLLYNTAEVQSEILKNFNLAITRINSHKRANYGYGIFNYNGRHYDIREKNSFFYERLYGGAFSLYYPFSLFNRIEINVSLANSYREYFGTLLNRKALLLTNSISYVHDNSLWSTTGPIDGSRFRFLLSYTTDIRYSNVNYISLIADYRYYYRLGLRSALAGRLSFYINEGKEARRYIAGGSWDLRGWPRWSIKGQKLWISSVELRFPLIDRLTIKFPFLGVSFSSIRGAVYFDAGSAWDNTYTETLGSIGFGFRFNLFHVITFRYDIGKKIEDNFKRLQPRLFYQFFFGWDF